MDNAEPDLKKILRNQAREIEKLECENIALEITIADYKKKAASNE